MKARGGAGQGLLLLQGDAFLPKHIKRATDEVRGGKDNTRVASGQMGSSTTQNLKSKKEKNLRRLCPTSLK